MGIFEGAAGGIAGAVVQGISMIGQKKREARALANEKDLMGVQFANQQKLNEQQLANQMQLNKQGQQIQMENWKNTSYPAQMKMMEAAGLNPGLMYGMSGGGGVTTGSQGGGSAQGGSAGGGHAPAPQPMELGNAIQTAMTQAQIKLAEAQAKKANAEAEQVKPLAESTIAEKNATIDKLISETYNEQLKSTLIKFQTEYQDILNASTPELMQSQIAKFKNEADKLSNESELIDRSMDSVLKELQASATLRTVQIELEREKIDLTEQQRVKLANDIELGWQQLGLNKIESAVHIKQYQLNKFIANLNAEYPGLQNALGSILKKAYMTMETLSTGKIPDDHKYDLFK